jgi:hypothetical protein
LDVFPEANKKKEIVEYAEFTHVGLGRIKQRKAAFQISVNI